jgi:hypothetical protein
LHKYPAIKIEYLISYHSLVIIDQFAIIEQLLLFNKMNIINQMEKKDANIHEVTTSAVKYAKKLVGSPYVWWMPYDAI